MKMKGYGRWGTWIFVALSVVLDLMGSTVPASAALGGDVASVQDDMLHMKASLRLSHPDGYTVHELQMQHGSVREFVNPSGKVFGVAWEGFFMPDMKQLLGTYFDKYVEAARRGQGKGRAPLVIHDSELVMRSTGHMRAWKGVAYVPDMVPQGVNVDDIR
jgi:hypothetical protein